MYNEMMDTIGLVNQADPELAAAMDRERNRQRENIELIASENIVSPAVMAAMGSICGIHPALVIGSCRHGGHGQHPDQQVRRGSARLRWIFMPCFLCVLHELLWAALCRTQ